VPVRQATTAGRQVKAYPAVAAQERETGTVRETGEGRGGPAADWDDVLVRIKEEVKVKGKRGQS
jgi:hypothetical protein